MKWLYNPFYYIIFFGFSSALAALALISGFVSNAGVYEIRGPVSARYAELQTEDMPSQIEEKEFEGRRIAIRRPVEENSLYLQTRLAAEIIDDGLWLASGGDAPENARDALREAAKPVTGAHKGKAALTPLLSLDGSAVPELFGVMGGDNNEGLDAEGRPLRWRLSQPLLAGFSPRKERKTLFAEDEAGAVEALARQDHARPASRTQYRSLVERFAKRYNLSVELVYAIIHSESDFSPSLVSKKSAMGLMQILPGTASGEVHHFLYGKRGKVSFAELRVPEINIHYGTAYLHILFNRYFQDVKNPVSREYCAIASYNLGPNRFLRLYGSTNGAAIEKLNQFTPEELYSDLSRRLPARETRFYLSKVRKMKNHYAALLAGGQDAL